MGDDFMVKDMSRQDPAGSMLRGGQAYQALAAADEQARQRALAQDPAALQVHLPTSACLLAVLEDRLAQRLSILLALGSVCWRSCAAEDKHVEATTAERGSCHVHLFSVLL